NMPVLRENQYNYIRFDTLNPPLQYSRTHDSIIPIAERSGAKFYHNKTRQTLQRFVRTTLNSIAFLRFKSRSVGCATLTLLFQVHIVNR
ncbi:MAG: hypothetical protein WCB15_32525, partial [Desulfobacterales bacterium]